MEVWHTEVICLFFFIHTVSGYSLHIQDEFMPECSIYLQTPLQEEQHCLMEVPKNVVFHICFYLVFFNPPNKHLRNESGECFGEIIGLKRQITETD